METPVLTAFTPADIRAAADAFRAANPRARARNVAVGIGVSEAELLATRVGGDGVTRLDGDLAALVMRLPELGRVMLLTRNDAVVHETTGTCAGGERMAAHAMGLFGGEEIDIRYFFRRWTTGFLAEDGPRLSFQFFDADGSAVHKVYSVAGTSDVPGTDLAAMRALAADFAAADQSDAQPVTPIAPTPERAADEIDFDAFHADWRALTDTHDFFGLLRRHGVSRRQAVRHAPADLARPLDARTAARRVLTAARDGGVPVMTFVGNEGAVQIHTGVPGKLVEAGPWYNVLDPAFNLHLDETQIDEAYVVIKPTDDGIVTSVELFDAAGALVLQLFGKRKPGLPEREDWRELVAGL